jgi:hypothetical protein
MQDEGVPVPREGGNAVLPDHGCLCRRHPGEGGITDAEVLAGTDTEKGQTAKVDGLVAAQVVAAGRPTTNAPDEMWGTTRWRLTGMMANRVAS